MLQSNFFKLFSLLFVLALFASCTKREDTNNPTPVSLSTSTFKDLFAPQGGGQQQDGTILPLGGQFTKFSFSKNDTVSDNTWDIAFRGTTIIVNGGTKTGTNDEPERTGNGAASIVLNTFDAVTSIPDLSTFKQDSLQTPAIPTGSNNGWYNYSGQTTNLITPLAGRVIVVRTHDGKYAKMEILSYYKDAPATPNSSMPTRFYTFKFVYQANGTTF